MTLSVVIPVYKGEKTIAELNSKLKMELEGSFSYNIIMVCDGAPDGTMKEVRKVIEGSPEHTEGYFLKENLGQHRAILYGIEKCTGDFIVTMDDDLQHDPVYIKKMVEKQKEGDYDVVYTRFGKLSHTFFREAASKLFRRLLVRIVPRLFPCYSPFRLIRRETALKMAGYKIPYIFIDGILGMITTEFGFIGADHRERAAGRSSYNFCRLVRHAVLIIFYYSGFRIQDQLR